METSTAQNTQTRRIAIGITAALVLAGGAWWYFTRAGVEPPVTPASEVVAEAPVAPVTPAEIQHPLQVPAETPADPAAPPPDADALAATALGEVFDPALAGWLMPEQLMRRLVATTDNLTRNTRTESLRPLRAPPSALVVERESVDATVGTERIELSPANFARYDAPMAVLARADMAQAAAVYRRIYPQLQTSWEQLGYPDRYFNDRVVEVIDHLLATPEPTGPLLLEQPKVLYRFADPDLESRSAGQKLLLRIGVNHARVAKAKLTEFRALIARKE